MGQAMQNKEEYIRKILDEIFDKCNELSSQRENYTGLKNLDKNIGSLVSQ